jgi:hypothetical protein
LKATQDERLLALALRRLVFGVGTYRPLRVVAQVRAQHSFIAGRALWHHLSWLWVICDLHPSTWAAERAKFRAHWRGTFALASSASHSSECACFRLGRAQSRSRSGAPHSKHSTVASGCGILRCGPASSRMDARGPDRRQPAAEMVAREPSKAPLTWSRCLGPGPLQALNSGPAISRRQRSVRCMRR